MIEGQEERDRSGFSAATSTRRRRPSGEPAPLPRHPLAGSGKIWVGLLAAMTLLLWGLLSSSGLFFARGEWWDDIDAELLGWVVDVRSSLLTGISQAVNSLTNDVLLTVVRWAATAVMLFNKRWRHLGVFLLVIFTTEIVAAGITRRMARIRPDDIDILVHWSGFSFPSVPFLAFTLTLVSLGYALVVPGRPRRTWHMATAVVIALVGISRLYLAAERLTDLLGAVIIGVAIPLLAFRIVVPDEVFPVSYSRNKTAHLDLTGPRRTAILEALRRQLGLAAESIELFGTEGSGGSTPLRVRLTDGTHVFAKLYAQNHLRSDRWYKLGRSLLYGALEDEAPYRTVRRLAEHEDHMMRLMAAAGVPLPAPRGVLEITPGREYLLVTDFLEGAAELRNVELDDDGLRSALGAVRAMWDAGLAHRDIKPANLMVVDGSVHLIDHAFGEIRPTAWREAADLANMILTLSLNAPPERVHRVAAEFFSEDEIGEAFAVARSITIPGELRDAMRESEDDLLALNRRLAPERPPIGIQRWTPRRLLALGMASFLTITVLRLAMLNRAIAGDLL